MKNSNKLLLFLIFCLSFTGFVLFHPQKALAATTFTVDSTGDASDASAGNGVCATAGAVCTLRAAIQESNALAGADTINFSIAGSGVRTISPSTNLPAVTQQLTINGTSQPGSSCGTLVPSSLPASGNTPHTLLIEIDGANSLTAGLDFATGSDNSIVRGLVINSINGNILAMTSVATATIECNYLGTNSAGTGDEQSTNNSVSLSSANAITIQNNLISGADYGIAGGGDTLNLQNNLIGTNATGTAAIPNSSRGASLTSLINNATISHNIVSGNGTDGMFVSGETFTVSGNYFGLSVTGSALGNSENGLVVYGAFDFTIGGTTGSSRNIFSANGEDGIHLYSDCGGGSTYDSAIFGNYVGTNSSGVIASGYGNQKAGIEINEFTGTCGSVYRHQIGGDNSGEPNIIAGNTQQGVMAHQGLNNDVFSVTVINNSVFGNGQIGIDLAADSESEGVADTDLGPNPINSLLVEYPSPNSNNYLNRPTINSASFDGGKVTVNYNFSANSVSNSSDGVSMLTNDLVGYRLDFYVNDTTTDGAYSGYSQSKTHLGSFIVDGSANGATHNFDLASLTSGQVITATSTLLWTTTPGDAITPRGCDDEILRTGSGPPYTYEGNCPK